MPASARSRQPHPPRPRPAAAAVARRGAPDAPRGARGDLAGAPRRAAAPRRPAGDGLCDLRRPHPAHAVAAAAAHAVAAAAALAVAAAPALALAAAAAAAAAAALAAAALALAALAALALAALAVAALALAALAALAVAKRRRVRATSPPARVRRRRGAAALPQGRPLGPRRPARDLLAQEHRARLITTRRRRLPYGA